MLKNSLVIVLIISLLSSGFSRFFMVAGFALNQQYIAENFCINKNRPWLHCNGHCYFMRKIKEAQENEKKQERADQRSRYQEALPVAFSIAQPGIKPASAKITYPSTETPATIERSYGILLPPKVV
jgi:hypothetical protein